MIIIYIVIAFCYKQHVECNNLKKKTINIGSNMKLAFWVNLTFLNNSDKKYLIIYCTIVRLRSNINAMHFFHFIIFLNTGTYLVMANTNTFKCSVHLQ